MMLMSRIVRMLHRSGDVRVMYSQEHTSSAAEAIVHPQTVVVMLQVWDRRLPNCQR